MAKCFAATHPPWDGQIHDHDIELLALFESRAILRDRLAAFGGEVGGIPQTHQHFPHETSNGLFVVDDQNPAFTKDQSKFVFKAVDGGHRCRRQNGVLVTR